MNKTSATCVSAFDEFPRILKSCNLVFKLLPGSKLIEDSVCTLTTKASDIVMGLTCQYACSLIYKWKSPPVDSTDKTKVYVVIRYDVVKKTLVFLLTKLGTWEDTLLIHLDDIKRLRRWYKAKSLGCVRPLTVEEVHDSDECFEDGSTYQPQAKYPRYESPKSITEMVVKRLGSLFSTPLSPDGIRYLLSSDNNDSYISAEDCNYEPNETSDSSFLSSFSWDEQVETSEGDSFIENSIENSSTEV